MLKSLGSDLIQIVFWFIVFSVLAGTFAKAEDRRVVGGDILHSARVVSKDFDDGNFRARAQAVKAIAIECGGFASKGIKIFKRDVDDNETGVFKVYVQAGISFSDCEAAKGSKPEERAYYENPALRDELAQYNKTLGITGEAPEKTQENVKQAIKDGFHDLKVSMEDSGEDMGVIVAEEDENGNMVPVKVKNNPYDWHQADGDDDPKVQKKIKLERCHERLEEDTVWADMDIKNKKLSMQRHKDALATVKKAQAEYQACVKAVNGS